MSSCSIMYLLSNSSIICSVQARSLSSMHLQQFTEWGWHSTGSAVTACSLLCVADKSRTWCLWKAHQPAGRDYPKEKSSNRWWSPSNKWANTGLMSSQPTRSFSYLDCILIAASLLSLSFLHTLPYTFPHYKCFLYKLTYFSVHCQEVLSHFLVYMCIAHRVHKMSKT